MNGFFQKGAYILFVLIFGIGFFLSVREIFEIALTIKTNKTAIGTVQSVTKFFERVGKRHREKFLIDIAFEENGEQFIKQFTTEKSLSERFSGYFDTRYRIGNKITILIGENNMIFPYSDRKKILFTKCASALFRLIIMGFFIFMLFDSLPQKRKNQH